MRIPLEDGSSAYGRMLAEPYVAFYDHRTATPSSDLDSIVTRPVLFRQAVRVRDHTRWPEIGWRDLEGEVAEPVVQFMQDVMDHTKCVIFDTEGHRREAAPEECVGLERAAVWEMHHIEQRLLDTFTGRSNEAAIRAHVRLE